MYNKRVLKTATDNLGKAKAPATPKDIIVDPRGQWAHPGQNTRIPSNSITMQGVSYPVLAKPNIGQPQMMYPGAEYIFPGADYVDEFPQMLDDDYIEADLTDAEIEEYAKGGFIIEDISVPELTKAQKGYITPTRADSLELYKQSQYLDKWMKQNKYDWDKDHLQKYNPARWKKNLTTHLKDVYAGDKKNKIKAQPYTSYVKKKGNLIGTSDWLAGGGDDYGLPFTYRHPNIAPQQEGDMVPLNYLTRSGLNKPYSYSFRYDPLAIKPGDMLTDAEVKARVKKYGPKGIPASKLQGLSYNGKKYPGTKVNFNTYGQLKVTPPKKNKTKVEPIVIGIPPEKNTDPTKMFVGTNEITSYDENGNLVESIEYVYDDVKLPIKKLQEYIPTAERVPQNFPTQVKPEQANMAFRYRDQWQHAYDPSSGGFKTYGTKQATLPYGEKLNEHQWEYNKSDELPESGHHVWQVGNKKYYSEEEAKAAAAQWDAEHSYQFKKGGSLLTKKVTCKKCGWKWDAADGGNDVTTCHKCGGQGLVHAQLGKTVTLQMSPYSVNANGIPLASKVFGEYNPELLIGATKRLPAGDQGKYTHNISVGAGLPYTGKFVPSVKANYHGRYTAGKPVESGFLPTVHSDLYAGYDPQQGINFGLTANPRAEFMNKRADNYLKHNWPQGAWKGYAGLTGGFGARSLNFDPNMQYGVVSEAGTDKSGGHFTGFYGGNAGFEIRPFRNSPVRMGFDASLAMNPTKKGAEAAYSDTPVGWTPMVKANVVYPLGTNLKKYIKKADEQKKIDDEVFDEIEPFEPDDSTPNDGGGEPTKRVKRKRVKRDKKKPDYDPVSFFGDRPIGYLPGYDPESGREVPESFTRNAYGFQEGPTMYKKGGSKSKKYTRSLEGKNEVFDENKLFKKLKNQRKKIFNPRTKYYEEGGAIELDLSPEQIQEYAMNGYIVEDVSTPSLTKAQDGGSSGNYFTVPGSDGVYRKVNGKWQVDWNRSGKFQPLSKGDVAKRTAVLNKQAKPLYDRDYNSLVESRSYETAPKKAAAQPQTATQKKAQQNFNQNFKVSAKDNYTKVKDRIDSDKEKLLQWSAENNVPIDQKQLDDYETWGWNVYGKVGAQRKPDEMHSFNSEAPQGFLDKTADVLSNPMTSLGYFMRGQDIPDYMQRDMDRGTFGYYANGDLHTERNPFDYVSDFTPLGLVNDTRNVINGISEGDLGKTGLGLLSAVPGFSELRSASKALKAADKFSDVSKGTSNLDVRLLPDNIRSKELDMETFGIYKGDQRVGEVSGNRLSNGDFETMDIGVDPKFQKQGIGTEVYKQLNQSLPEGSKVKSWGAFVENNGIAPGRNTWQSLEKQGLAKQNEKGIYEMIPKKSTTSKEAFKSEIDWSKWNKEIPENTPLMQEYNAIEESTKANGTWMKNSDGTKFKGTPEQFVQQNSENFKKAFGDTPNIAYRGQTRPTETIGGGNRGYDEGISYLGDKDQALTYAETWKYPKHSGEIYQPGLSDPNAPALYELMYPNSTNKKIITHSEPRSWQKLTDDDVASQMNQTALEMRGKSYKGEQFINTDDVGNFVAQNNLDYAYIPNIMDYARDPSRKFFNLLPGKNVGNTLVMNSKPGNYLKSRWYNNGMFDMSNPNIYKSLLPYAVPTGIGIGAAALQQEKDGGIYLDLTEEEIQAYKDGGYIVERLD